MPYGQPNGWERPWSWDCPTLIQAPVRLDASTEWQEMVGTRKGIWGSVRVDFQAPPAWLDVVFELWVQAGKAIYKIQTATPRASQPTVVGAATLSTTLFSVRDYPCDRFFVRAKGTGAELGAAQMSMFAREPCAGNGHDYPQIVNVAGGVAFDEIILRPSAIRARMIYGTLDPAAAADRFVLLFDRATLAPAAAVPDVASIPVNPGGVFSWAPPGDGHLFQNGMEISVSTTFDRKVLVGAGNFIVATVYFN